MKREYIQKNVYEAVQERFDFLFREFENIYVSFSGGKDSGLLLNLLLDFKRTYYPQRTVGLLGAGYWQLMNFFRPNWLLMEEEFRIIRNN